MGDELSMKRRTMRQAILWLLLVAAPASAQCEDYLLVFAGDRARYQATHAHTFAAVVRIEKLPGALPRVVDFASISWLPETMKVRALAVRSETGRNVPLDETLRVYTSDGHVCMWGPYRIQPELTEFFKSRAVLVESSFRYKGASFLSPRQVCDCTRAIEEMVDPNRRYIGVFGYGAAAASVVVRNFSPWIIDPEQKHPWVATLLGLDEFPLICRSYGDFTDRHDQMRSSLRKK
jgi:hypothetical protein